MTIENSLYIDAVILYGQSKSHSVSIQVQSDESLEFVPFDLSDYSVRFRVLGSATKDALVLIEKNITQVSDEEEAGIIYDASGGAFNFVITVEDTKTLGLGAFPISIDILDLDTGEVAFTLTEGNANAQFNKIRIVQV